MASTILSGTATNPQAGTTITGASVALAGGVYTVTVIPQLSGTIAAGDLNNYQVSVGATVVAPILFTSNPAAAGNGPAVSFVIAVPSGGATLAVQAVANASGASAVYKALLIVTSP